MEGANSALAILVAVLAWPLASVRVSAECISDGGSPDKRLKSYPLVFVGDVRGVEGSVQPNWLNYRVKFQVIEPFRGIEVGCWCTPPNRGRTTQRSARLPGACPLTIVRCWS